MKKSFLTIVALGTMLASCSNDETLDVTAREAITFDRVFVENATRAIDNSYPNTELTSFHVYGTITNSQNQTANLFNKELVTKGANDEWGYNESNTQYWIPGNTYHFTAIADGNISLGDNAIVTQVTTGENGMPTTIELKDAAHQKDILYAVSEPITYESGAETVGFTFNHLLAKAKFTVKNEISTNNGYTYQVSDVCITNAYKTATYTIGSGWGSQEESYSLSFGNIAATSIGVLDNPNIGVDATHINHGGSAESNFEKLLIPFTNGPINISFTSQLYKDNVLIQTKQETITASNITLAAGNAYNFVIKLGNPGEPIQFTVTNVNGWDKNNNNNNDVNVNN
ncbi:MAG: fimbrillin family protein [Bacteroidaceae bacterium]|nr:fimbrillin family protein [Bacteroidaceae bacterium]